jgi:hypothetical protein
MIAYRNEIEDSEFITMENDFLFGKSEYEEKIEREIEIEINELA